ncbi:MAG TPA: hypothetical protein VLL54_15950 [Pyrinomonadaceae bacterium]|nr:hypothetical protein [Pyrinomonadaceae bacterium]
MTNFAIGVEDHYGWANLVSVVASGRDIIVIDKRRVELIEPKLPASPYHHETLQMQAREAEKLVKAVKASANKRARLALASLIRELAPANCSTISIRTPPLAELPVKVSEAHANYFVMCRADGMIYHQALTRAAGQLELNVFHFEKSKIIELAARVRGLKSATLERRLKALGSTLGPPWQQGHVVVCAGALAALGPR